MDKFYDKVIEYLAYRQEYFTGAEAKEISMVAGVRVQSGKDFISTCTSEGWIEEAPMHSTTTSYYVKPEIWIKAMKNVSVDELKKRLSQLPHRLKVKTASKNFGIAMSQFLHNEKISSTYTDSQPLYNYEYKTTVISYIYIPYLLNKDEFIPFLTKLPRYVFIDSINLFEMKLANLTFVERDLDILQKLNLIDDEDNYLKSMIGGIMVDGIAIYYDFFRNGDIQTAINRTKDNTSMQLFFMGIKRLQAGDPDEAYKIFKKSISYLSTKSYRDPIKNFYYGASLLLCKSAMAKRSLNAIDRGADGNFTSTQSAILALKASLSHNKRNLSNYNIISQGYISADRMLAAMVCKHYNIGGEDKNTEEYYKAYIDKALETNAKMLIIELSNVFPSLSAKAAEFMQETGLHPTLPSFKERPQWENILDELITLNEKNKGGEAANTGAAERIAYEVDTKDYSVQPKLQKSKNGVTWTSGRNIALTKFASCEVEGMTSQDKAVAQCVEYESGWYYGATTQRLQGAKVIATLAGHPHVRDSRTGQHLDIVMDKPEVRVTANTKGFSTTTNIDVEDISEGYYIDTRLLPQIRVVKVDESMRHTIKTLTSMSVPQAGKEKLTNLLGTMSKSAFVMSDLLQDDDSIQSVEPHSEIIIQLKPIDEQVRCMLCVRPFGSVPPLCKVGKGMEIVTTTINGQPVRTSRDIAQERKNGKKIKDLLTNCDQQDSREDTWMLSPEECLDLLNNLRDLSKICTIEWPEGERFKVSSAPLTFDNIKVSVGNIDSWFEMSGDVKIDTKKKIKIAELLNKLSDTVGNYIKLEGDEYIKVTTDLRKYLDTFSRIAKTSHGKIKFSPFNALQLEGMEQAGMEIKADETFRSLITRIHESADEHIKIPKAIQADLRTYQKEGFEWMSRLAHWGAGALLADDMGLGKTVQTITMLLSRAKQGPQLVIMPTSLIINWRDEIARFAPSLTTILLNHAGTDRAAAVKNAKPFDIVICTYGLLITEEENLTSRTWTTVVLDEAHTIKNKETKMSKAAMQLQANFRLLLTGTPLQNHVSEMWNLMQFANPYLLGGYKDFSDRFILPIERDHDKGVQKQLKRIISPFILRRTKTDVLNELPEKTEITLKVDLSEEELAFYDTIREEALANLASGESTAVKALAEITRLRQAACNSLLVNKDVKLPSSKMECFMQLVSNLHDNHHRALVFSQFTSHLALVRQRLEEEGVEYLYLDGATPAKERLLLVDKFQHGDMPLFLISLKAGGLGLNLTAADYVIHLDPWWNPAIEEQASDRAYRIGQQNPVTVYRLIASGTIEEKILSLHQTKRNMADALLEGSDVSAAMNKDEMLALIKEQIER